MISTKIATQKAIAINAVITGTVLLSAVASSLTFSSSAFAQYGLGLPKSAGTGGSTRGSLPQITLIVPEDGAKTLAARPTFYWYIAPDNSGETTSTTIPKTDIPKTDTDILKPDTDKRSSRVTFFVRDSNEKSAKSIFIAEGKAEGSGLYKFTLPENAPELVKGKVQRWQIRWQSSGGALQVDVNAPIRRDDDPVIVKAIASAKNDLEKARIYAKNAYWYDAIDTYTSWLSQNPKDDVARTERSNLLKEGLQNNTAFSPEQKGDVTTLVKKINESKSAISIALQSKTRR